MHRLETISHIRQRASNDYAHRVVEIGAPHFFFEADRDGFFSELVHENFRSDCKKRLVKPLHKASDFSMCGKLESPLTGTKRRACEHERRAFSFGKKRAVML